MVSTWYRSAVVSLSLLAFVGSGAVVARADDAAPPAASSKQAAPAQPCPACQGNMAGCVSGQGSCCTECQQKTAQAKKAGAASDCPCKRAKRAKKARKQS